MSDDPVTAHSDPRRPRIGGRGAVAGLVGVVVAAAALLVATSRGEADPDDVDCSHAKCVALTFDDGPTPFTDRLLRVLADNDGHPGHVFNLGHGVLPSTDPAILEQVVALVHEEGTVSNR